MDSHRHKSVKFSNSFAPTFDVRIITLLLHGAKDTFWLITKCIDSALVSVFACFQTLLLLYLCLLRVFFVGTNFNDSYFCVIHTMFILLSFSSVQIMEFVTASKIQSVLKLQ